VLQQNPVTADNCSVTKLTWALTGATTANSAATGINNLGTQVFNLGTTMLLIPYQMQLETLPIAHIL
jgi:hypothetical protein